MKYIFPKIKHIDDVLSAIEDVKEFIVVKKDHFTVVNYVISNDDTFPKIDNNDAAIRRECRGLLFCNETGDLLSRKFHKFFNINEKEETQIHNVDISQKHVILEKLDGSMLVPVKITKDGESFIRWTTKMGITDVAMNAETFAAKHPRYNQFAKELLSNNYHIDDLDGPFTPIFEWCSRKNRIVIDYKDDNLILLAIRHNTTGKYIKYDQIRMLADCFSIDVVDSKTGTIKNMQSFVSEVSDMDDSEGYVIQFDDGHMLKLKSQWYCKLHKAKELIDNEKYVVRLILDNELDDTKSFLLQSDLNRINKFEKKFHTRLREIKFEIMDYLIEAKDATSGDRKDFAINYSKKIPKHIVSIIFKLWDKKQIHRDDIKKLIMQHIRNNTYKTVKYNLLKEQYGLPCIEEK